MTSTVAARRVAFVAFVLSFLLMIANGRAIGSGDTNAVERTAAALAERGTFILPDSDAPDPFTWDVGEGRVSIYPALPALLAAPFFLLVSVFFDLNLTGLQVAGKLVAAMLASGAVALLAFSFARRSSPAFALASALLIGLGTSVFSTSQALWQHPAAVFFLALAVLALERMEGVALSTDGQAAPALAAGFALALVAASRPAAVPMCAVLFAGLLWRVRDTPRIALRAVVAAALPMILVAAYNTWLFGAPWRFRPGLAARFGDAFPESIAGLLISPARGLLIFTPLVLVGLWGLMAQARVSPLARLLLAGTATHLAFMSFWNEWHGGESFGPRLLTDMLPALFFYLPEGLKAWPRAGVVLGVMSMGVQFLGGWTYDYRWERLHQRGQDFNQALWSWRDSPLPFAMREGVIIQGFPTVDGRRIRLPVVRSVPFGPRGSLIEVTPEGLRISGAALVRDVRLERGARLATAGGIRLSHPGDALAFRVVETGTRVLRLAGSLQGTLRVEAGESAITLPSTGPFDMELPLRMGRGEDIFIRAETGDLILSRVEVRW